MTRGFQQEEPVCFAQKNHLGQQQSRAKHLWWSTHFLR